MLKLKRLFGWLTSALMAIVIAGFIPGAYSKSAPPMRLDEEQAIQIARTFCQKIGQPVTVPAVCVSPAKNEDATRRYWQACWQVNFSGQAQIEVADATGVITDYSNEGYFRRRDNAPVGEVLPKQEAIQLASTAVNATGQSEPIQLGHAELLQTSNSPQPKDRFWSVYWPRTSQGISYRDQHISVSMDAQTGEIQGLVLMFPTPPLASVVKILHQEEALNIAANRIVSQGIEQEATHSGTELEIIQPDPDQKNARLAWVSTFVVDGHWRQIETDTETGEILGEGKDNGPAGRQTAHSVKMPLASPISQMLKTAQAVYLRGKDAKGTWTAKPFLKFNAKTQPHAIAMLTKIADFRQSGPAEVPSQQIVLVNRSHAIGVYSYSPKTGLLGNGSDWAVVPSEFQKWLQRTAAVATASPAKAATK